MSAGAVIEQLRAEIAAEGPPLADALVPGEPEPVFGSLVAGGSRTKAAPAEYALLVESIFEGYLLHYASGRLLRPDDRDVSLLGGDFLYANGLAALARLGDAEAIQDLAGLIALCAQASRDRSGEQAEFGEAFWALTGLAVAGGRWPQQQELIAAARQGDSRAAVTAANCATQRAEAIGLTLELERALIAFSSVAAGQLQQT